MHMEKYSSARLLWDKLELREPITIMTEKLILVFVQFIGHVCIMQCTVMQRVAKMQCNYIMLTCELNHK